MAGMFLGTLLGGGVGAAYGQFQFERAWQQVQTNPRSIQGNSGSYLCAMGDAPIYAGMLGALLGMSGGLGMGLCWWGLQKAKGWTAELT